MLCIVMARVYNTKQKPIRMRGEDMNKDRKDVINVNFTLTGKDYGVLVVDIC